MGETLLLKIWKTCPQTLHLNNFSYFSANVSHFSGGGQNQYFLFYIRFCFGLQALSGERANSLDKQKKTDFTFDTEDDRTRVPPYNGSDPCGPLEVYKFFCFQTYGPKYGLKGRKGWERVTTRNFLHSYYSALQDYTIKIPHNFLV